MNKKFWIIIISVVTVIALAVSGVLIYNNLTAFKPLSSMPGTTENVIGNGGSSVQKGDYLYFTYGYIVKENIEYKQNEYNEVDYGGIYRIKLDNGNLPTYSDSEGYDVNSLELVVPKIASTDRASLYIFDDYLYYASPSNRNDREGNLLYTHTDFFRVKLNGEGNELLYSTSNDVNADSWGFVKADGQVSFVINDGGSLNVVAASGSAFGDVKTLTDAAQTVVFADIASYVYSENGPNTGMAANIYYTVANDTNLGGGNNVYGYNLETKNEPVKLTGGLDTYTLISFDNNKVLYSYSNNLINVNYIGSDASNPFAETPKVQVGVDDKANAVIMSYAEDGTELAISENYIIYTIANADGVSFMYKQEADNLPVAIAGSVAVDSIITVRGTMVYFKSGTSVYSVDAQAASAPVLVGELENYVEGTPIDVNQTGIVYFKTFTATENAEQTKVYTCMLNIATQQTYILGEVHSDYRA